MNEKPNIDLQLIGAGNEQAFRDLFLFYAPKLNQFAFSLIKSKEASAEIVNDVFIKLWKQKEKVSFIGNIRVYLYVAVRNSAINYLSLKVHRQVNEPFDFADVRISHDPSPDEKMITAELMSKITAAVESLPPRCKMIFKLVREDGLRYKEVADILNLTVNTVDAQMVIAVKRISEKVQTHFTFFPSKPIKK